MCDAARRYTARCSGEAIAAIKLGRAHVCGSPYHVTIKPGPLELLYRLEPALGLEITTEAYKGKVRSLCPPAHPPKIYAQRHPRSALNPFTLR